MLILDNFMQALKGIFIVTNVIQWDRRGILLREVA